MLYISFKAYKVQLLTILTRRQPFIYNKKPYTPLTDVKFVGAFFSSFFVGYYLFFYLFLILFTILAIPQFWEFVAGIFEWIWGTVIYLFFSAFLLPTLHVGSVADTDKQLIHPRRHAAWSIMLEIFYLPQTLIVGIVNAVVALVVLFLHILRPDKLSFPVGWEWLDAIHKPYVAHITTLEYIARRRKGDWDDANGKNDWTNDWAQSWNEEEQKAVFLGDEDAGDAETGKGAKGKTGGELAEEF